MRTNIEDLSHTTDAQVCECFWLAYISYSIPIHPGNHHCRNPTPWSPLAFLITSHTPSPMPTCLSLLKCYPHPQPLAPHPRTRIQPLKSQYVAGPGAVKTPIWDKAQSADVSAYADTLYAKPLQAFVEHMVKDGQTSTHTPEYIAR